MSGNTEVLNKNVNKNVVNTKANNKEVDTSLELNGRNVSKNLSPSIMVVHQNFVVR